MVHGSNWRRGVALAASALVSLMGLGAVAAPAAAAPEDSVIVDYDFSEGAGTTVSDLSGNGNDGSIVGGEDWLVGQMNFNGSNYVKLPDGLLADATAATIVIEVSPQLTGGNHFVWNIGGLGHSDYGTGQFFLDPLRPRATITKTNWQGEQNATSPTKLVANEWHSLAVTIAPNAGANTSTLSFYVDGQLMASNQNSAANLSDLTDHTRNFIGKSAYEADNLMRGKVSSFSVYTEALDAATLTTMAQESASVTAGETTQSIDLAALNSQDLNALEFDMVLPTAGGVTWTSSSPVIAPDGTVTPAETATDVTLTATADVRGTTSTRDFVVSVIAARADTEMAQADLDQVTLVNPGDVRGNLNLPEVGEVYGSAITWASSDPDIIAVDPATGFAPGVVTRPTDGDRVVTLTTTATSGTETATKTFEVTVRQATTIGETTSYLFAHFTGLESKHTDEQIYFALSEDGRTYHDTRADGDPILAVAENEGDGGVRDPYLVRSPEGDKFFLIATDLSIFHRGGWGQARATEPGSGSTKMVVWESNDLVNWSEPRLPDIAGPIPDAGNMWAPEAIWSEEDQAYFVFWATRSDPTNTHNDAMNMHYAWTRDFVTFTEPEIWIDRSHSIIDTTVIKIGDWYYRASGDGQITIEKSQKLDAPTISAQPLTTGSADEWVLVGTLQSILGGTNQSCSSLTNFSGGCYEGPEFFTFNADDVAAGETLYGLYADLYGAGMGYKAFETVDPSSASAADWAFVPETDFGTLKKRHGTVLPITDAEYDRVTEAFDKLSAPVEPEPITRNDNVTAEGLLAEYFFVQSTGSEVPNLVEGGEPAQVVSGNDGLWTGDSLTLTGGNKASGPWVRLPSDLLSDANSATVTIETKFDESMLNRFHFLWNIGSDSTDEYWFASVRGGSRTAIKNTAYAGEQNARGPQLDPDRWYSLTSVIDGDAGTISWFIDGEHVTTADTDSVPSDILNHSLNAIGRGPYPDPLYAGEVATFRVYDRALTPEEIMTINVEDAKLHSEDLLASANASLDGLEGLTLDDSVVALNDHDGQITWSSQWDPVTITDSIAQVSQPANGEPELSGEITATANVRGQVATRNVPVTVLPEAAPDDAYGYLMVHFVEDSAGYQEKIYLDISRGNNPEQWDPLNGGEAILASNVGTTGVRDPFITYNPENQTYYIIATDLRVFGGDSGSGSCTSWCYWSSQGSTKLNVWESQDLINWSPQRQIDVNLMPDGTQATEMGMAWAPEATWVPDYYGDGQGAFVMYWSSNLYDENDPDHSTPAYSRIMWAATTDFTQDSFEFGGVLFDNGGNLIDTTMIQDAGFTYAVTKDNSFGDGLILQRTDAERWWEPGATWDTLQTEIAAEWAGGNPGGVEGAAMFKKHNEDVWYLYADVIPTTGYRPMMTTDLDQGFEVLNSSDFYMAPSTKHGGVIGLTKAQYDAIRAADGEAIVSDVDPVVVSDATDTDAILAELPTTLDVQLAYDRGVVQMPASWEIVENPDGTVSAISSVVEIGANLNAWMAPGVDPERTWGGPDAVRELNSSTRLEVVVPISVAAEPTDPVTPTDPVSPTDPVGPTDPSGPTDPAGPTDPSGPTSPGGSQKPIKSGEKGLVWTGAHTTTLAALASLLVAAGLVLRRRESMEG